MKPLSGKLLFANWKANKSLSEARHWLQQFAKERKNEQYHFVICPPFPLLSALSVEFPTVVMAAQDLSVYEAGPYTGEVPGYVLQDLNVRYVILGHSERRKYQHETSAVVAQKAEIALAANLIPVICVDRNEFQAQIDQLDATVLQNAIFAYEPVHAISSFGGHEDPLETTLEAVEELREIAGRRVPVLYGGSVDPENSLVYLKNDAIDGVLVGKSSLDPHTFAQL